MLVAVRRHGVNVVRAEHDDGHAGADGAVFTPHRRLARLALVRVRPQRVQDGEGAEARPSGETLPGERTGKKADRFFQITIRPQVIIPRVQRREKRQRLRVAIADLGDHMGTGAKPAPGLHNLAGVRPDPGDQRHAGQLRLQRGDVSGPLRAISRRQGRAGNTVPGRRGRLPGHHRQVAERRPFIPEEVTGGRPAAHGPIGGVHQQPVADGVAALNHQVRPPGNRDHHRMFRTGTGADIQVGDVAGDQLTLGQQGSALPARNQQGNCRTDEQ